MSAPLESPHFLTAGPMTMRVKEALRDFSKKFSLSSDSLPAYIPHIRYPESLIDNHSRVLPDESTPLVPCALEDIESFSALNAWSTAPKDCDHWTGQENPLPESPRREGYIICKAPTQVKDPTEHHPRIGLYDKLVHSKGKRAANEECGGATSHLEPHIPKWHKAPRGRTLSYESSQPHHHAGEKAFKRPSDLGARIHQHNRSSSSSNRPQAYCGENVSIYSPHKGIPGGVFPESQPHGQPYATGTGDGTSSNLLESHASTTKGASYLSLLPRERAVDEVYLSQQWGYTCYPAPQTEANGTEVGCENNNGDILHRTGMTTPDQMLFDDESNLTIQASCPPRPAVGGRGRSGSTRENSFPNQPTAGSGPVNPHRRAMKGGTRGSKKPEDGKKEPNGQEKRLMSSQQISKPCLYYLAHPNDKIYEEGGTHFKCRKGFRRTIQHLRRSHLKPAQCKTCGYRSDHGQVEDHRKKKCVPKAFENVDEETLRIDKLIVSKRNYTWLELFDIIFGAGYTKSPEAERYISYERAYPDLCDSLARFMQPVLPVIMQGFCGSHEFMDICKSHPGLDLDPVQFYTDISDAGILDIAGMPETMFSRAPGGAEQSSTSQNSGSSMALFNTTNSYPLAQKIQSDLRNNDRPSDPDQFIQSDVRIASISSGVPKPTTESSHTKSVPSSPRAPPVLISGAVSSYRDEINTAHELVKDLFSHQENILDFKVESQAALSPSGTSDRYSSFQFSRPGWNDPPQQHNVDNAPNRISVDQSADVYATLVPWGDPSSSSGVPKAVVHPQDESSAVHYGSNNPYYCIQSGTISPKLVIQTRSTLPGNATVTYPSSQHFPPQFWNNDQHQNLSHRFDQPNTSTTESGTEEYPALRTSAPQCPEEHLSYASGDEQDNDSTIYELFSDSYPTQSKVIGSEHALQVSNYATWEQLYGSFQMDET